jgi:hypothetical protein
MTRRASLGLGPDVSYRIRIIAEEGECGGRGIRAMKVGMCEIKKSERKRKKGENRGP